MTDQRLTVTEAATPLETDRNALSEPLLLSVDEAAHLLGIGRTVAYRLLSQGDLRSVKVGGRRLIPRVAIERFVCKLLAAS